jgi:hypothetical protein
MKEWTWVRLLLYQVRPVRGLPSDHLRTHSVALKMPEEWTLLLLLRVSMN